MMVMAVGYCAIYLVANGTVTIDHPDKAVFRVADYLGIVAQLVVYPAVLAAALSTSSLFLSLAGNIVSRDLPSSLGLRIKPAMQMTTSRIAMSVMGVLAIGFAAVSGDMVAILGTYGFGTLTAATFPIFIVGLLWKGASSQGVMLGMLTALVTTIGGVSIELLKRFGRSDFAWPGGVPWYVFVMAAAVLVTILASLLTQGDVLDRRVEMAMGSFCVEDELNRECCTSRTWLCFQEAESYAKYRSFRAGSKGAGLLPAGWLSRPWLVPVRLGLGLPFDRRLWLRVCSRPRPHAAGRLSCAVFQGFWCNIAVGPEILHNLASMFHLRRSVQVSTVTPKTRRAIVPRFSTAGSDIVWRSGPLEQNG